MATKKPQNRQTTRRKARRFISVERKAEMVALVAEMGSAKAVAETFGVAVSVVTRAAANPAVANLANMKKAQIADRYAEVVERLLRRFTEIADTATLDDKSAVLLGIAADKFLLYVR